MATAQSEPILHVNWGPDSSEDTGKRERKWCFACRKHGEHALWMYYDSEPSYYEPVFGWLCPTCGKDKTEFGDGW